MKPNYRCYNTNFNLTLFKIESLTESLLRAALTIHDLSRLQVSSTVNSKERADPHEELGEEGAELGFQLQRDHVAQQGVVGVDVDDQLKHNIFKGQLNLHGTISAAPKKEG